MGEYTGRRRGRPEPEARQEPAFQAYPAVYEDADYFEEPDGYQAAAGHRQDVGYRDGYREDGYRGNDAYRDDYSTEYSTEYDGEYGDANDADPDYREDPVGREPDYAEPRLDPIRRRAREAEPEPRGGRQGSNHQSRPSRPNRQDRSAEARQPRRPANGNPLPVIGAAVVALAAASFISAQAVAVVTAVFQVATVWAVLDLMSLTGRRAAIVATIPALAADAAVFGYRPDESATGVVAAIGCGFVLVAIDTVLRTGRRGVEPGASRELAVITAAMLLACLTGLSVAAARLDHSLVAAGAVLAGLLAFAASRSPRLPDVLPGRVLSRAFLVGPSFTTAALVSYAAAILLA